MALCLTALLAAHVFVTFLQHDSNCLCAERFSNDLKKKVTYSQKPRKSLNYTFKNMSTHTNIHTQHSVHISLVYFCLPVGYFRLLQLLSNQTANQAGRGRSHQQQTACPLSLLPLSLCPALDLTPLSVPVCSFPASSFLSAFSISLEIYYSPHLIQIQSVYIHYF